MGMVLLCRLVTGLCMTQMIPGVLESNLSVVILLQCLRSICLIQISQDKGRVYC